MPNASPARCIPPIAEADTSYEPTRYYDDLAPAGDAQHLALLAAVVRRAVIDYCERENHKSAKAWFTSDSTVPFSLRWIAAHLWPADPEGFCERLRSFIESMPPKALQLRVRDTLTL